MRWQLFILLSTNILYSYSQQSTIEKEKPFLTVEVGSSTSTFFENYTGNRFNPNEWLLATAKLAYYKNKLSCFLDFKIYLENHPTSGIAGIKPGYIASREYEIVNWGVGYVFQLKKLKLFVEPSIMLSTRPYGHERVVVEPNYFHPGSYRTIAYSYESLGFGFGINIRKPIYKKLFISLEVQYNHFFETKKSNVKDEYDEFDKTYNVNRNMITPSLKLGYQINLRKN